LDRTADIVRIDVTNGTDAVVAFLARIAGYKGITAQMTVLNAHRTPSLLYRGVQIEGLWPCVDYLLDVRPAPETLPDTPAKRGIMRSCVDQILYDPRQLGQFYALYFDEPDAARLPARRVTILDIAIASYAHTLVASTYPWVQDVATEVDARILGTGGHTVQMETA